MRRGEVGCGAGFKSGLASRMDRRARRGLWPLSGELRAEVAGVGRWQAGLLAVQVWEGLERAAACAQAGEREGETLANGLSVCVLREALAALKHL